MALRTPYDEKADEERAPGPGHDRAAGKSSDPRGENAAAGDASDPRGDLQDQETGGGRSSSTSTGNTPFSYNPRGDAPKSDDLKDREESAPNDEDSQSFAGDNFSSTSTSKRKTRFTRRQKTFAGVGATTLVGVSIGFFSIASGPLEFVHIAQLLDKFHFLSQQDAQDGRLMKIARYIKDPTKPQNTRLGLVGNKTADHLTAKMHEASGLTPEYNTTSGRFEGYVVDEKHNNFKGKNSDQITEQLSRQYGVDKSTVTKSGDKVIFNPDVGGANTVKRYVSQVRTSRTLLGEAGYNKVVSYVGTRVLGTRAGWTFHPIKALDASIQAKTLEGGKAAIDKVKQQFNKQEVSDITNGGAKTTNAGAKNDSKPDASGAQDPAAGDVAQQGNDSVGTAADGTQQVNDGNPDAVAQTKDKLSAKAKAGGAAGAAGFLCVLKGLHDEVETTKQDKAILPMMRMASRAMSEGSQAQSGQDITALQLGFDKDLLDAKDKNGNVTSTWDQAQSIQYEEGQPMTGQDIPKEGQVFSGNPLDFINQSPLSDILGPICSVLGGVVGTVVGIVTGPINFLVSTAVMGDALNAATGWMVGAPVDPLAAGVDRGNYMNYGAKLSANEQYASVGGVPQSPGTQQALRSVNNALDQSDFKTHSVAYRIFNPYDNRTLAAHIIDDHGSSGFAQTVASMFRGFGSIFTNAVKNTASLFYGTTHATSSQTYDYHGIKNIGFSPQELADTRFENPFDNACHVVGCHPPQTPRDIPGIFEDAGNLQRYTDLASKCFGVTISGDAATGWTIDSKTKAVNMYSQDYPSAECSNTGDENWFRVRFWLLDTNTLEGYDCFDGTSDSSDQSCQDLGFADTGTGTSDSSTSPGSPGSLPTGSAKDLASQLLPYIKQGKISCNGGESHDCSDIQNTANGTSIRGGQGCLVDALQPGVLGLLLGVAKAGHTVVLSALCSDHHNDGLRGHAGGRAADFNYVDSVYLGEGEDSQGTIPWTAQGSIGQKKIQVDRKLLQDVTSFMPKSTGFGQTQCHAGFSFLSGFSTSPDGCHHQHIQVET